jgi:hypothetical protein
MNADDILRLTVTINGKELPALLDTIHVRIERAGGLIEIVPLPLNGEGVLLHPGDRVLSFRP